MGWAAPVANVVGALGGALIGNRGQSRAAQSQERATMAQIQLERERDAARSQRYERAYSSYEREKQQYDQIRRALLGHYGVNFGEPAGGGGGGAAPAPGDVASTKVGGMTLGQLVGRGDGGMAPADPMGGAPGAGEQASDDVFDWRNYGVSR